MEHVTSSSIIRSAQSGNDMANNADVEGPEQYAVQRGLSSSAPLSLQNIYLIKIRPLHLIEE